MVTVSSWAAPSPSSARMASLRHREQKPSSVSWMVERWCGAAPSQSVKVIIRPGWKKSQTSGELCLFATWLYTEWTVTCGSHRQGLMGHVVVSSLSSVVKICVNALFSAQHVFNYITPFIWSAGTDWQYKGITHKPLW